jgi:hypothetical protein
MNIQPNRQLTDAERVLLYNGQVPVLLTGRELISLIGIFDVAFRRLGYDQPDAKLEEPEVHLIRAAVRIVNAACRRRREVCHLDFDILPTAARNVLWVADQHGITVNE